jgi:ubiquinone/menaquinone biosynthesis C-methylase UbiE
LEVNAAERERWNNGRWAAIWPKRERLTDEVTARLLDEAALGAGERVLDIGCGGGRAAIAAAGIVGDEGAVTGADVSRPLLALAEQRAQAAGAGNVRFQLLDMQTAPVPGAPFDVAISQFGVMFFDEPVQAFRNIRAQLRPGGRLVFACWQSSRQNPWLFTAALREMFPPPPEPAPGKAATGPFSLADPAYTTETLEQAGFRDVRRTPFAFDVEVPLDAVYDEDQLTIAGLPEEQRPHAHAAVLAFFEQFAIGDGRFHLPLAVQVFRAANQ